MIGAVGISLIGTVACRSSSWQSSRDVAALQAERRAKVEKTVGLKRTEAELQLARDAWTFGDRTACLSALDGILEREPGRVEALLLKAEVHLAKDEVTEADRSIAIALSHDPSNSTARRLSEIARTKQLAACPRESRPETMANLSAPLPGAAVSQAAYTPAVPGTADAGDEQPKFVRLTGLPETQLKPLADPPAGASLPVPPEAQQPKLAHLAGLTDTQLKPAADPPAGARLPLPSTATPTGAPPRITEPAGFSEAFDLPVDPLPAVEATPSRPTAGPTTATDEPTQREQPPIRESAIAPGEKTPVTRHTRTEPAHEPDASYAGIAEATDQRGENDSAAVEADPQPEPVSSQPVAATAQPVSAGHLKGGKGPRPAVDSYDPVAVLAAVEQDLIDSPNDPQVAISAAVAALEANQAETSASIARLGIAFHPSCAGLHRTLGAALYRTGNYRSSQVALQEALSLDKSAALSYFLMGCVLEKLGDTESARAQMARAAELDPSLANREQPDSP
ncbi:MAG: tetratricopeptide repeat protein [Thermoguttaceae bacterium]